MADTVFCPKCGHEMAVKTAEAGRSIACVRCGETVPVSPEPGQASVTAARVIAVWVVGGVAFLGLISARLMGTGTGGVIVVMCAAWTILLASVVWASRVTLWFCMIWVALTALYMAGLFANVRHDVSWGAMLSAAMLFLVFLGLVEVAHRRRRAGRTRQGAKGRQGAWLLGTYLVAAVVGAFLLPPVGPPATTVWAQQCRTRLRQIGLALHSYHDSYGCFPPAVTTDGKGRPMHNWLVYLLPYLVRRRLCNASISSMRTMPRPTRP